MNIYEPLNVFTDTLNYFLQPPSETISFCKCLNRFWYYICLKWYIDDAMRMLGNDYLEELLYIEYLILRNIHYYLMKQL